MKHKKHGEGTVAKVNCFPLRASWQRASENGEAAAVGCAAAAAAAGITLGAGLEVENAAGHHGGAARSAGWPVSRGGGGVACWGAGELGASL